MKSPFRPSAGADISRGVDDNHEQFLAFLFPTQGIIRRKLIFNQIFKLAIALTRTGKGRPGFHFLRVSSLTEHEISMV